MRLSIKLLAVLLFAIVLAVVWPGGNASLNHSSISHGPDSSSDSMSGPNALLPSRRGMFRRIDADPLAATMISLRTKMRQWHDSLIADADNEDERARLLQEMLALVTDENVAQVVQSLSVEEMNTDFGSGALHHWMQADPVNATDWLATRAGTTPQQTLSAADDWITRQQGLQDCIDQLPATEWKQSFLASLGSEKSASDPHAAIQFAEQMTPGDAQENVLRSVACDWVEKDPNAALEWVAGVQNPALRDQLVASAVQAYALVDPAQAATWLVSEVKNDAMANNAAANIAESWAAKDPETAAKWVAMFPAGNSRDSAVNAVFVHWLSADPNSAVAWVQTLPEGSGILASLKNPAGGSLATGQSLQEH